MSGQDLIKQPKMRRSVQVGYRRLARPVIWPAIARASAPAETPDSPPVARTFPWGMMERVRQALADEPAPPAPASRRSRERPAAVADAEPQVRRQVVVEETPARPRPAPGGALTELGDLPAAVPDAEPDSGPFLQAQTEPEEEGLDVAQAAPPGTDQAPPFDPAFAPPEVSKPAWAGRSAPADRQSPSQLRQAVPEPATGPRTPPAEAAPWPLSAAKSGSRASDAPHATAVERAASQDAPATAPAAGDGQAAGQPDAASLPAEGQPDPGVVAPSPSSGGELPMQPPAGREPEALPATAGPLPDLWSNRRDPRPAPPQVAQPAAAPVQSGEEPPSQIMPAAQSGWGGVQRTPESRPEATPGARTEPASPPQAVPETGSQPAYQVQTQPEGAELRQTGTPLPQAEPGEGDGPTLALTETVEGGQLQPAAVGQEPAEVMRMPVPPTEARQEATLPTEVRQTSVPPTEVRRIPAPPTEARQGHVPPTETRQKPAPPTEVMRMPVTPADAGLVHSSAAPSAPPPFGSAEPPFGTQPSAKRPTRKAPSATGEPLVSPGPEGDAWGDSAQATSFDAPAVVQAAPAAGESTVPAAAPPPSVSSVAADSAPPAAVDVDTLARQVYQILRRRLQVEYERNLGHGR